MKLEVNKIISFGTYDENDRNNVYGPYRVVRPFNLKLAIRKFNDLENKPKGEHYTVLGESGDQIDSQLIKWLILNNYLNKIPTTVIELQYGDFDISDEIESFDINNSDDIVNYKKPVRFIAYVEKEDLDDINNNGLPAGTLLRHYDGEPMSSSFPNNKIKSGVFITLHLDKVQETNHEGVYKTTEVVLNKDISLIKTTNKNFGFFHP